MMLHLRGQNIHIDNVYIPSRNRALNLDMAERLIKVARYAATEPLDKFIILIDLDGSYPEEKLLPFRAGLLGRLGNAIDAPVLFAYAQWHLEAWYFADAGNLKEYLGRELGSVDTSKPDDIQNPKLHLKHLLDDRVYTAEVSQEIAGHLDAHTIAERSPSFRGFRDAVLNGNAAAPEGRP